MNIIHRYIITNRIQLMIFFIILICKKTFAQNISIDSNLTPPNGISIADNLFCDKTEIDNIAWNEYMYWTKQVFGETSDEFRATLPDYKVWNDLNFDFNTITYNYFTHPLYDIHPIVGITQQQAIQFSKWRSDRYFEHLLIQNNIISKNSHRNKDNYFTIEKYFKGELKNIINKTIKIEFYPYFHLPNIEERKLILTLADSLISRQKNSCKKKKRIEKLENFPIIHCNLDSNQFKEYPIRASNIKEKKVIYNIRGNVAEWSSLTNLTFGGSWNSDCKTILINDTASAFSSNAYTGFRNTCSWKKWTK